MYMRLAAELEPDLILPKLNLARLARAEGHMASAQAQYRTVLEQFPHHAIAALELTDLLLREGNHEEALDHIRRILETDPLLFQAHELRLKAMFAKREDPGEIRTSLYDLTKTFPDEARASLVAGKGYRQLGDLADAKVQFRRTVETARLDTDLLFKTANQQFGIGDNSGALWSLTKAEQASPKHKGVGVLKAAVLTELENFRAAEQAIQALYDNHGAKADILTVHGDFYMARKQHVAAVDVYHQAFELVPSRKTIRTSFRAMVVAGDIARATTLMESWIAEHPRDFGSKHLYAQMLVREKEWVKAQAIYEGLMADGIEDAVLLNNLATSYQYLGDDRALPIAEAAYKKAPGNPSIIDTYGWILTENGKVDEGLALLREAYARASTSPEIRYHIGLALARLGRDEEAAEEVEAALAESYSFPAVEAARALLDKLKASLN